MKRGQQLVDLALNAPGPSWRNRRFSIVKLLEFNKFHLVPTDEVKPTTTKDVYLVKYHDKQCRAISIHSGEKKEMEISLQELVSYEKVQSKYKNLAFISKFVQTELKQSDASVQTDAPQSGYDDEHHQEVTTNEQTIQNVDVDIHDLYPHIISSETISDQIEVPNITYYDKVIGIYDIDQRGDMIPVAAADKPHERSDIISLHDLQTDETYTPDETNIYKDQENVMLQHGVENTSEKQEADNQAKRRKQFCIFCDSHIYNLQRHLFKKHSNEARVQEILDLSPKDVQRKFLLSKIRREGYVKLSGGTHFLARKGGKAEYVPCHSCGAYFGINTLHRHFVKCTGKKPPKNLKSIVKGHIKLKDKSSHMCEALKNKIIPGMSSKDSVVEAIVNDKDIIEYGNMQCIRFGDDIDKQKNLIRARLRALAKLKLCIRDIDNEVKNLIDVFQREKWNSFVEGVQTYAHLEAEDSGKQSPTNVHQIGLLVSNIAKDIKAGCSLDEKGKKKRAELQAWLELYERKYRSTIGWQASKLAARKKWKSRKLIPLAEDIMKLNVYLKNKLSRSKVILATRYEHNAFEDLNKAAMLLLLSFNRKRIGEMMTITTEDYQRKEKIRKDTDIFKGLTKSEKMFANNYFHLLIRGKLIRPVPILISTEIAEGIDLLLLHRDAAGVSSSNKHLFAKKGDAFFDANLVFREAAYACGAEVPEDLTSTSLRKHIATVSQALNLTDGDLKVLCGFLGHTTQTHMEHYRLPSDAVHTAKLSRLLSAFDTGKIHKFRGKTIEEIDTDIDIENDKEENVDEPEEAQLITHFNITKERPTTPTRTTTTDSECSAPQTPTPPKKRYRWTTPEKQAMKRHFNKYLLSKTLPSLKECNSVRRKVTALRRRQVQVMKAWVSNENKKKSPRM